MHMDQAARPCPLVQVIDILRDDQQIAIPFGIEPGECFMRGIGVRHLDVLAPLIVKAKNEMRIPRECLWRRDVFDAVFLPKPSRTAKGINTALRADASARQDNDIADLWAHGLGVFHHGMGV